MKSLDRDNVEETLKHAHDLNYSRLVDACLEFIGDNFEWFMAQESFLKLGFDEMETLLERYTLGDLTEENRYTALKKWHFTKRPNPSSTDDFLNLLKSIDRSKIPESLKTESLNALKGNQLRKVLWHFPLL